MDAYEEITQNFVFSGQYMTDRWTEAKQEEGKKGKEEGREFVKAVYIFRISVCVHRNKLTHFVWLHASIKSASTFSSSSVVLNKNLHTTMEYCHENCARFP